MHIYIMTHMAATNPIPAKTLAKVANVLRVIGHSHRLRILELLETESLTVGELAERLGIAPHACSQHLRIMLAHRILEVRREGKSAYYHVVDYQARNVIECIRERAR